MAQRSGIPERLLEAEGAVLREEVFRYSLSEEILRAVRYRNFFSLGLIGIDGIPGDPRNRGEPFLKGVASAVGAKIRRTDPVGLLDGGFAILLLHAADEPAVGVTERLRNHMREVAILPGPDGRARRVTISVGGACFPRDGQTEDALITHASRCLEVARRLGGDRVVYQLTRP